MISTVERIHVILIRTSQDPLHQSESTGFTFLVSTVKTSFHYEKQHVETSFLRNVVRLNLPCIRALYFLVKSVYQVGFLSQEVLDRYQLRLTILALALLLPILLDNARVLHEITFATTITIEVPAGRTDNSTKCD